MRIRVFLTIVSRSDSSDRWSDGPATKEPTIIGHPVATPQMEASSQVESQREHRCRDCTDLFETLPGRQLYRVPVSLVQRMQPRSCSALVRTVHQPSNSQSERNERVLQVPHGRADGSEPIAPACGDRSGSLDSNARQLSAAVDSSPGHAQRYVCPDFAGR